jgi:hypothetical protein
VVALKPVNGDREAGHEEYANEDEPEFCGCEAVPESPPERAPPPIQNAVPVFQ